MVGVAVLTVAGLLLADGPAAAQAPVTWDEAAALAGFPVYKPARTFGLKARVEAPLNECVGTGKRMVTAGYGAAAGGRPRIMIWQAAPYPCGDPGESRPYRTVRIRGRKVQVRAFCETLNPRCALRRGQRHSWLLWLRWRGGERHTLTVIEMTGSHVPFKRFVAVARSLRRVDVSRPTVRLNGFLSPDRRVWCGVGLFSGDDRWCSTDRPQFGGSVSPDGTVRLCGATVPANPLCIQNWDDGAPVLRAGQRSDYGGYVCLADAGAVICTVKAGAGKGRGFRVDAGGVSEVAPVPLRADQAFAAFATAPRHSRP
jgi:hypothetical protein